MIHCITIESFEVYGFKNIHRITTLRAKRIRRNVRHQRIVFKELHEWKEADPFEHCKKDRRNNQQKGHNR